MNKNRAAVCAGSEKMAGQIGIVGREINKQYKYCKQK